MMLRQTLDDADIERKLKPRTVLEELNVKPFGVDFQFSELERYRLLAEQRTGARGKEAREILLRLEKEAQEQVDDRMEEDEEPLKYTDIQQACKALKISEKMLTRNFNELSGGWKMRVQLAKALLFAPDLLLLDEPTNHLDIAGVLWLQKVLNEKFDGFTIVFVSHNRSFLNAVAKEIIWFKNQKLEYFKGNYDTFLQTIEEKELFAQRYETNLEKQKERMQASIQATLKQAKSKGDEKLQKQAASKKVKMETRIGFMRSAKGHRFKLNRDRIGKFNSILAEVEHVDQEQTQKRLSFNLPPAALPRVAGPLLSVEDLCFKRVDAETKKVIFELKDFTFNVEPGERVAILGANGEGKSTLLNLLAQEWLPTSGTIQRKTSNIGYFRQEIVTELGKDERSALQRMKDLYPGEKEPALWKHLGSFGLGDPKLVQQTRMCDFSGGQRVAYSFAEISYSSPALLLLDEPNSHLDLDALEALEDSLCQYEGAIVFVSHDISFVVNVATTAYWVSKGVLEKVSEEEDLTKFLLGKYKS
jgi:ATP-binding cassette, subfamily F, member 3